MPLTQSSLHFFDISFLFPFLLVFLLSILWYHHFHMVSNVTIGTKLLFKYKYKNSPLLLKFTCCFLFFLLEEILKSLGIAFLLWVIFWNYQWRGQHTGIPAALIHSFHNFDISIKTLTMILTQIPQKEKSRGPWSNLLSKNKLIICTLWNLHQISRESEIQIPVQVQIFFWNQWWCTIHYRSVQSFLS